MRFRFLKRIKSNWIIKNRESEITKSPLNFIAKKFLEYHQLKSFGNSKSQKMFKNGWFLHNQPCPISNYLLIPIWLRIKSFCFLLICIPKNISVSIIDDGRISMLLRWNCYWIKKILWLRVNLTNCSICYKN